MLIKVPPPTFVKNVNKTAELRSGVDTWPVYCTLNFSDKLLTGCTCKAKINNLSNKRMWGISPVKGEVEKQTHLSRITAVTVHPIFLGRLRAVAGAMNLSWGIRTWPRSHNRQYYLATCLTTSCGLRLPTFRVFNFNWNCQPTPGFCWSWGTKHIVWKENLTLQFASWAWHTGTDQ